MLLCASKLESLSYQDRSFFNLKIKSIKCIVDIPEYAKILYCYIKPISRTSSSVNIGAQSFKDFVGPSKVSLQYYLFGLSLKKLRNCVYINFIHKICIVFGVGAVQIWTHLPRNVSIQFWLLQIHEERIFRVRQPCWKSSIFCTQWFTSSILKKTLSIQTWSLWR